MDNIQLYHIDNEINKVDEMKEGDVIYKNGVELLVVLLYSASGVLTVMMHGDREDNPIPEMLPNAGTNPDNIITTVLGIDNDGGDW